MKKGLAPLSYHRWLIPRRQRAAFYAAHPNLPESQRFHAQQQGTFYRPGWGDSRAHGQAYAMGPMGYGQPPPPAYPHDDYVPAYTPPQGPNKVDPNQNYAPPPGAPPTAQQTGVVGDEASGSGPYQEVDLGQRR